MTEQGGAGSTAVFDRMVENTLLDLQAAGRYLPLQVWEEYQGYREALRDHLAGGPPEIRVVVPVSSAESVAPLVSLIVWNKAAQLEQVPG